MLDLPNSFIFLAAFSPLPLCKIRETPKKKKKDSQIALLVGIGGALSLLLVYLFIYS